MANISRRSWMSLAVCACASIDGAFAAEAVPAGYTSPFKVPDPGRAPGMMVRQIASKPGAPRAWAIIFAKGDEVMSGLVEWARRENIGGAHLTALGAFSSSKFAWFDKDQRAYLDIPVDQQAECVTLVGDVGLVEGHPALHVHGCVALRDGTIKGGHLLEATVWPTLELFATESAVPLEKRLDPQTDLEIFDLKA